MEPMQAESGAVVLEAKFDEKFHTHFKFQEKIGKLLPSVVAMTNIEQEWTIKAMEKDPNCMDMTNIEVFRKTFKKMFEETTTGLFEAEANAELVDEQCIMVEVEPNV